jgi:hypothetical protein
MIINGFLFGLGLMAAIIIVLMVYRYLVERRERRVLTLVDQIPNLISQSGRRDLVEIWEKQGYSPEEIRFLLQSPNPLKAEVTLAERLLRRKAQTPKEELQLMGEAAILRRKQK